MNHPIRAAILTSGGAAPYDEELHIPSLSGLVVRLSRSMDVTVFSPSVLTRGGKSLQCGVAEVRILPLLYSAPFPRLVWALFRALTREHREHPFNLVHGIFGSAPQCAALLFGKRHGIPSLLTFAGGETARLPQIGYGNLVSPLTRALTLRMAAAAEGLALLTEYQHAQLQGAGIQRPVEIIPFGVDLADYRFDPDRFPREPFRLLFVGNLIPVKNPDFLIRVAGALRARCDFTMEILGQDRLEGSMQRLAAELGIADCVQFHGYQPHRIVRDRLLEADALLLVSLHEAQGVAAAEAAAAGVLIAGTRVGLLDDLAPTGALVVDDGEPERFADILLSALRDRAVYRSHIQAARAWIERHDADSCAAEYRTVYRRLAFPGARGTSSEPE